MLRPIAPEDRPLVGASFERLGKESRYRRFFTTKNELSATELDYLVDVDHHDHEAIVAIDPSSGEGLGVGRYVRSGEDPELAEVAVTVADDWQGRGLGRALLDRLTTVRGARACAASAPWSRATTGDRSGWWLAPESPSDGQIPARSSSS